MLLRVCNRIYSSTGIRSSMFCRYATEYILFSGIQSSPGILSSIFIARYPSEYILCRNTSILFSRYTTEYILPQAYDRVYSPSVFFSRYTTEYILIQVCQRVYYFQVYDRAHFYPGIKTSLPSRYTVMTAALKDLTPKGCPPLGRKSQPSYQVYGRIHYSACMQPSMSFSKCTVDCILCRYTNKYILQVYKCVYSSPAIQLSVFFCRYTTEYTLLQVYIRLYSSPGMQRSRLFISLHVQNLCVFYRQTTEYVLQVYDRHIVFQVYNLLLVYGRVYPSPSV